jgi:hypothetical protein
VPTPLHVGQATFANAKFRHEKASSPINKTANSLSFIKRTIQDLFDVYSSASTLQTLIIWICLNKLRKKSHARSIEKLLDLSA